MSSGEDWTQHWILTNMGSAHAASEDDSGVIHRTSDPFIPEFQSDDPALLDDPLGIVDAHAPDEGVSTSPVTSIDLDRESPMACGLDDDDAGPPSIETQPPDHADDLEVSQITSTWISSGGHYTSLHPGLGYNHTINSNTMVGDSTEINVAMPGLDGGDFNAEIPPVYGPALPIGPYNSPVRDNSPILYGDVTDDNAASGLCGLRNLGNTCFMAAGIQCLVNTPPIAQYFFNHHLDNEESKSTLAGRFSQLTHKMWSGNYSSIRPSEFKEAFGQHWRDFRDYRQHDCQEFMTLLLEALRKQMPLQETDSLTERNASCTSSSICSRGSRESRGSASPTPPQSPSSPSSMKQPYEMRGDAQEDSIALDSGAASPKSSISSCSVDAHLISLRLQPIPEEVKCLIKSPRNNTSTEDLSVSGTVSCQDAESVTSDMSDSCDGANMVNSSNMGTAGVASVRRYNHLSTNNCDTSTSRESEGSSSPSSCLKDFHPDASEAANKIPFDWETRLDKNEKASLERLSYSRTSTSSHLSMVKLEDIMKETKTSNVNVLAKDSIPNNEFLYDSEKYAKVESKKLKNSLDNLSRGGLKRVKEVNLLVDKMDNSQIDTSIIVNSSRVAAKPCSLSCRNSNIAINKRIRLEEKNVQYEIEKSQSDYFERISEAIPSTSSSHERRGHSPSSSISTKEQRLSDESWKSFLGDGKSAVVDTFYGQFKSSLVCCVCGHTSVKFDPFGTLSVPLPHANEIQIPITYVPHEGLTRTRCLLTLFKVSTVLDIKNALAKLFGPSDNEVVITEVFDNHIARTVDEACQTKFLKPTRNIYAFELASAPLNSEQIEESTAKNQYMESETEGESEDKKDMSDPFSIIGEPPPVPPNVDVQWQQCNICLEELCQTELKTHEGCDDCCLCETCIIMSARHHGQGYNNLPCPVCQKSLSPTDLIPVAKRKTEKPKARILRVPVVFRIDTESDDNNKREMMLLGHPSLLHLPSRIKYTTLLQIIKSKLLTGSIFSLLFVEGRGYNCSRCLFSSHCRGCEVPKNCTEVDLLASDTLCVRFTFLSDEQREQLSRVIEHNSLLFMRQTAPLTIYDCLKAFTQSETLEDSDSWYCPKCERKQQATKTISVWKYPPYLIIHLERFLFHGAVSTKLDDKVIFPVDGLDLSEYVAGDQSSPLLYNLYSCVCHMGGAHAGHYTALVRSPVTGDWHYFNDDSVTRQKPREDEYSSSYLLFYHRQGAKFNLPLPKNFAFTDPSIKESSGQDKVVIGCSEDPNILDGYRKRVCLESEAYGSDLEDRRPRTSIFRDNLFEEEERQRKLSSGTGSSKTFSNVDSFASTSSFNSFSQLPTFVGTSIKDSSAASNNSHTETQLDLDQIEIAIAPEVSEAELESSSMETGDCNTTLPFELPTDNNDCDNVTSSLMEE